MKNTGAFSVSQVSISGFFPNPIDPPRQTAHHLACHLLSQRTHQSCCLAGAENSEIFQHMYAWNSHAWKRL